MPKKKSKFSSELNQTHELKDPLPLLSEATYHQIRAELCQLEQKSADQHDKTIVALSGGALVISVTFIEKIAPNPAQCTYIFLISSWFFFSLSLLAILLSFLTSQLACQKQRELWDAEYQNGVCSVEGDNKFARWTQHLNIMSYGVFLLGVVSLLIFAGSNLGRSEFPDNFVENQVAVGKDKNEGRP